MPDILLSLGRILLLLAGVYVVCAVGAHSLSRSMLFPRPPLKYAPGPEYITLTAPDGTTLMARHWPNPSAKHTLLYLHGNYEDLGGVGEYLPEFVKAGYAVFAFDYRGYGLSGGTPDEQNLCTDTQVAYDYLRTKLGVPADRIVLFGYSLGGGPAVELASKQPVAGIVLQGAFVSAYRVMTRIPLFPGDKFENLAKMAALRNPVMIIHGTADDTVPYWHGEKLYKAISHPKKYFLSVRGGPHSGLADFAGSSYWESLQEFTESL